MDLSLVHLHGDPIYTWTQTALYQKNYAICAQRTAKTTLQKFSHNRQNFHSLAKIYSYLNTQRKAVKEQIKFCNV